jgi:hypothetical protein
MTSIAHKTFPAYITLAASKGGDWEKPDWKISTGKGALEAARYHAKRMIEEGYKMVSIREVSDGLYGGFHEKIDEESFDV